MADGKGLRWGNFTDRPKHLIEINGSTLLERLTNQILSVDASAEIIITARDERYEVLGAVRHVPLNNENEIDRFTEELIENNVCFLYGDTYYTDAAVEKIINTNGNHLLFFGNHRRIVAVKVFDGLYLKKHLNKIKKISPNGKGWDVYQSHSGLQRNAIGQDYVLIENGVQDFNTPQDYLDFVAAGHTD